MPALPTPPPKLPPVEKEKVEPEPGERKPFLVLREGEGGGFEEDDEEVKEVKSLVLGAEATRLSQRVVAELDEEEDVDEGGG